MRMSAPAISSWLALGLLCSGCAAAYKPPTATVWGYQQVPADTDRAAVVYFPTRARCDAAFAKQSEPALACQSMIVEPGTGHWAFSVSVSAFDSPNTVPVHIAATSPEVCQRLRDAWARALVGARITQCGPIALRFVAP